MLFSVLVKRLAGNSISEMTYIVTSGMYNLNSINHARANPCIMFGCYTWFVVVYCVMMCYVTACSVIMREFDVIDAFVGDDNKLSLLHNN